MNYNSMFCDWAWVQFPLGLIVWLGLRRSFPQMYDERQVIDGKFSVQVATYHLAIIDTIDTK